MRCKKCGALLSCGSSYCRKCGTKIERTDTKVAFETIKQKRSTHKKGKYTKLLLSFLSFVISVICFFNTWGYMFFILLIVSAVFFIWWLAEKGWFKDVDWAEVAKRVAQKQAEESEVRRLNRQWNDAQRDYDMWHRGRK